MKSTALGRILSAGILAVAAVAAGGLGLERARFGASDDDAIARVKADAQRRVDTSAEDLATIVARAALEVDLIRAAPRDTAAAAALFDALDAALPEDRSHTGITIYDPAGAPVAWAGRVSGCPKSD